MWLRIDETSCPGPVQPARIGGRAPDVLVPLAAGAYDPRADDRLIAETTRPPDDRRADAAGHAGFVA